MNAMTHPISSGDLPGDRLRQAVADENPLQVCGVINAYCAKMAQRAGFRALYLSGGGVAAGMAMPDLGITTMHDLAADAARITDAVSLPLLVDADVGFGGAFSIARATRLLEKAGVAGIHLEDQIQQKRCGHRPNKELVDADEMSDRIRAAADARRSDSFVLMARTDALASEPMPAVLARAHQYVEAGADMIFLEAARSLDDYKTAAESISVPILANITEFGQTPLFTTDELRDAGVALALYPLSAFRAMNRAAWKVMNAIRKDGTQKAVIGDMQTRDELYDFLGYRAFEQKLDDLFSRRKKND